MANEEGFEDKLIEIGQKALENLAQESTLALIMTLISIVLGTIIYKHLISKDKDVESMDEILRVAMENQTKMIENLTKAIEKQNSVNKEVLEHMKSTIEHERDNHRDCKDEFSKKLDNIHADVKEIARVCKI